MRGLTFLLAATAVCIAANHSLADDKIRLAQTGNVTTCMMQCNSQAANCQTTCLIPAPPPTPGTTVTNALTGTTNTAVSTACLMTCGSTQISCQTTCARQSPSQ